MSGVIEVILFGLETIVAIVGLVVRVSYTMGRKVVMTIAKGVKDVRTPS